MWAFVVKGGLTVNIPLESCTLLLSCAVLSTLNQHQVDPGTATRYDLAWHPDGGSLLAGGAQGMGVSRAGCRMSCPRFLDIEAPKEAAGSPATHDDTCTLHQCRTHPSPRH